MEEALNNSSGQLICIGGLPGTGKTTLAIRLIAAIGGLIIDPDLTRLEILGRPANSTITDDDLTPEITRQTIALMRQRARSALASGQTVVIASSSVQAEARDGYKTLAAEMGRPFHAFWLTAPQHVLAARLLKRQAERRKGTKGLAMISAVSLAQIDPKVVTGVIRWPAIDAVQTTETVLKQILSLLLKPQTAELK